MTALYANKTRQEIRLKSKFSSGISHGFSCLVQRFADRLLTACQINVALFKFRIRTNCLSGAGKTKGAANEPGLAKFKCRLAPAWADFVSQAPGSSSPAPSSSHRISSINFRSKRAAVSFRFCFTHKKGFEWNLFGGVLHGSFDFCFRCVLIDHKKMFKNRHSGS